MSLPDTKWFKARELACKDGTPYPEEWLETYLTLTGLLDKVRDLVLEPVSVVSGYRTESHNRGLVKSSASHQVASGSRHVKGEAADIRTRMSAKWLHDCILAAYNNGLLPELGGLGLYEKSNWVHVDTFRSKPGHLRRWVGI